MLKTVEKKSKNSQKTRNEYYCSDCDYYTSRKNDYEKHSIHKFMRSLVRKTKEERENGLRYHVSFHEIIFISQKLE